MSSSPTPELDFGRIAPRYDELRNIGENWPALVDVLVRVGDLRGRRVLDVGCGTGRLARLLVERYGSRVWGVDPEPAMIEVARERVPAGVGLKVGRAEDLPFKDRWFERATMTLVLQVVDRPRAYAEIHRVLQPGGRLGIVTFDYAHFERYFLGPYFPSFEARDKERFPSATELEEELRAAGFRDVELTHLTQRETVARETVLQRIRSKHISTFQLISDDEYRSGLERAERELPDELENVLEWIVAAAER
jgi:ubiquinone/menaquinone biosynthesis C-methylase UbiE